MTIRVALNHRTTYRYDRHVGLGPQIVRLRPAPHNRTPIVAYSMKVTPKDHFINWQQDPFGNFLARLVFPKPVEMFEVEIDLQAEMTVINPFDFFLEESAEKYPFKYSAATAHDLEPFTKPLPMGPHLADFMKQIDRSPRRIVDFLVDLNQLVQRHIGYVIRMEPGVQTPDETLELCKGSCRDSAWLLVQMLRNLGLAARFTSGYLIQLVADQKPLEGPEGPTADFTDLHAWTEVFLPGAGWIGLDPTSGLMCGEGHIPLASTPDPTGASPISGAVDPCETEFDFAMSVRRVHEDPRVTKPYTEDQWARIDALGHQIDERLVAGDVRLTQGGEPTFVSVDDMEGAEWRVAAVGPMKEKLADVLIHKLKDRFTTGGLLHYGQGKWYPGEQLPRWAKSIYWRTDKEPLWNNPDLFARVDRDYGHKYGVAEEFTQALAERLGVKSDYVVPGYEDVWYYLWRERRLPINVDVRDAHLQDIAERERLARVFEKQGLTSKVGAMLPIRRVWSGNDRVWQSGVWPVRPEVMFLLPGDSPMGFRLPLDSLPWYANLKHTDAIYPPDFFEARSPLPAYEEIRRRIAEAAKARAAVGQAALVSPSGEPISLGQYGQYSSGQGGNGRGERDEGPGKRRERSNGQDRKGSTGTGPGNTDESWEPDWIVRTALCVEPRHGRLHVFLPPTETLEDFIDVVAAIEDTAETLAVPVVIEGYPPNHDPRLNEIKVTPDPGVIEVNVHPASTWEDLKDITTGVYEEARASRLATEHFDKDGKHTGTGGGNHVVLGGRTPNDSPFIRRPDLLRSLVSYWNNHPSLSYIFSGMFIGPTSQAPRVDEGRRDSIYELGIACEQVPPPGQPVPPWIVDRIFRDLLVDLTGNTHRAEFCIDKLYSPDTASGRRGLLEFRAFEMPPHSRMSLVQQLLLRGLITRFWDEPYQADLVRWDTQIHDRWMLPHFLWEDLADVIQETQAAGLPFDETWFAPHWEFRCPRIGEFTQKGVHVELRSAIEPWYVLGEEPGAGGTARYVDSSVERLQVKVQNMTHPRYVLTVNGRKVPLHPTGVQGEYVAGVRYRAWQPPSCLHPTIPVDDPLNFDLVDLWQKRSVGGGRYYVGHPGGNNPDSFPVNANEAESRRAARFFKMGHLPGTVQVREERINEDFPLTLDLRRGRS